MEDIQLVMNTGCHDKVVRFGQLQQIIDWQAGVGEKKKPPRVLTYGTIGEGKKCVIQGW